MMAQDKPAFAKLILAAADKYHREFTENFLEIYWHCLQPFTLQNIRRAFISHFQNPDNGHFMPQPSDIIRILQGDSQTQALEAWTKVMHAISQVGAQSSIVFDDFLIHIVISDMDGWVTLCSQTREALKFCGIEFQKRYRGRLLKRPQHYPNRLIGIHEHHNRLHGYAIPSPQLFGNEQAAFITYSEGCEPHQSLRKVTQLNHFMASMQLQLNVNNTQNLPTPIHQEPITSHPKTRGQTDEE
jgi:hypothetical protein